MTKSSASEDRAARSLGTSVRDKLAPVNVALALAMRGALFRLGTDVTDASARRSCLVIAPHPDDETLGAGATIMRKVEAGTEVHIVVATDGSQHPPGAREDVMALRTAELRTAVKVLGLSDADITQLSLADSGLAADREKLTALLADAIAARRPAEVLVTSESDRHEDHATLGAATRRVLAGTKTRLLAYPIWIPPWLLLSQYARLGRPELVSTSGFRRRKWTAITAYESQLAESNDDEGLRPGFLRSFDGAYEVFFRVPTLRRPFG